MSINIVHIIRTETVNNKLYYSVADTCAKYGIARKSFHYSDQITMWDELWLPAINTSQLVLRNCGEANYWNFVQNHINRSNQHVVTSTNESNIIQQYQNKLRDALAEISATEKMTADKILEEVQKPMSMILSRYNDNALFQLMLHISGINQVGGINKANPKKLPHLASAISCLKKCRNLNHLDAVHCAAAMTTSMISHSKESVELLHKTGAGPSAGTNSQLLKSIPENMFDTHRALTCVPHLFTGRMLDNANNQRRDRSSRKSVDQEQKLGIIKLIIGIMHGESEMQFDAKYLRENWIGKLTDSDKLKLKVSEINEFHSMLFELMSVPLNAHLTESQNTIVSQMVQKFPDAPKIISSKHKKCVTCGKLCANNNNKCDEENCGGKLEIHYEDELIIENDPPADNTRSSRWTEHRPSEQSEAERIQTLQKLRLAKNQFFFPTPVEGNPSKKQNMLLIFDDWSKELVSAHRLWDVVIFDGSPHIILLNAIDSGDTRYNHFIPIAGKFHELQSMIDCYLEIIQPLSGLSYAAQTGHGGHYSSFMQNKDTHQSVDFIYVCTVAFLAEVIVAFREACKISVNGPVGRDEFMSAVNWALHSENQTLSMLAQIHLHCGAVPYVYKKQIAKSNHIGMRICRLLFAPVWAALKKHHYERIALQEEYNLACMEAAGLPDLAMALRDISILSRNGKDLMQGADAIQEEINRMHERLVPRANRTLENFNIVSKSLNSRANMQMDLH